MIDHIYLPVSDLNRSSEFYKKMLGPLGIDMPYKFDQPPIRGAIQDWLGHRAIQHTTRYTELSQERFKDFWRP
jgi:catechol 2,3-dioxygenase-like lactoylglutathione lyase family enzyme